MNSKLYNILEWITKFDYVNLLCFVFTLAGGIILGFYPATVAMFAMVRDWLRGKSDVPILKTDWNYYKTDFFKSNLLGIFINILIELFAVDIFYITLNEQLTWTHISLFAFILIVILFIFFVFQRFAHYDFIVIPLILS